MRIWIWYGFFGLLLSCQGSGSSSLDHIAEGKTLSYEVVLDTLMQGFTDTTSWFYPSIGVVRREGESDQLVMTIQKWRTGRSDVFTPVLSRYSEDGGNTWSELGDRNDAFAFRPADNGFEMGLCNFTPKWHAKSKTLLGTCHSVPYRNRKLIKGSRTPIYSKYDAESHEWTKWTSFKLPNDSIFFETNACADQRVDLPDGDILFPIYYRAEGVEPFQTTVVRCSFDGEELRFQQQGNNLSVEIDRGLFEPSLTKFGDMYYLTMRNDQKGYWAESRDGLNFSQPKVWHFDDGTEVSTYNTMQHWVTHSEGLFLVYTRRGAGNDHIIRHRAPLFMARVDTSTMRLVKDSEQIVVPDRGVTLGNFSVSNVSQNETWITVAELMRGGDEILRGANGNVFAAKIVWSKPNATWSQY